MNSDEHAAIGASLSAIFSLGFLPTHSGTFVVGMYVWGVLVSVFIDLDHFLIARYYFGHWEHLERCLRNPRWALTEQEEIFDESETERIVPARLVTHAAIGVGLTAILSVAVGVAFGLFTGILVAVHLVADALRDRDIV